MPRNKTNYDQLQIDTKLYYSDTQEYFGRIVKVLKRDVHVERPDGTILKQWQKALAVKMLKKD